MISRSHPGLIKRLFEMHTPEIKDGTVEIKAVSREAGSRTKIAVWSKDENVDAVGACIGPKGSRVSAIVEELGGEKITFGADAHKPEHIAFHFADAAAIAQEAGFRYYVRFKEKSRNICRSNRKHAGKAGKSPRKAGFRLFLQ